MVTSTCAGPCVTCTSAAPSPPGSQPSGVKAAIRTVPSRAAGAGDKRTPGRPERPAAGAPGGGKTQKSPVSRVIRWPETRSSMTPLAAGVGGEVEAAGAVVAATSDIEAPVMRTRARAGLRGRIVDSWTAQAARSSRIWFTRAGSRPGGSSRPRPRARSRSAGAPRSKATTSSPAASRSERAKHQVSGQIEGRKPTRAPWARSSGTAWSGA